LPALTITATCKRRWQIELFFKWIKNLRIKTFYGTSENAVRTQIWIAICVYLLVACLNKVHGIDESMSRIMQILSVNVFQKVTVNQLLGDFSTTRDGVEVFNQLIFNDLKLDTSALQYKITAGESCMALKTRIEYERARYHLINRGNYRSWIFESAGARKSFFSLLRGGVRHHGLAITCVVFDGEPLSSLHQDPASESGGGNALVTVRLRESFQSLPTESRSCGYSPSRPSGTRLIHPLCGLRHLCAVALRQGR